MVYFHKCTPHFLPPSGRGDRGTSTELGQEQGVIVTVSHSLRQVTKVNVSRLSCVDSVPLDVPRTNPEGNKRWPWPGPQLPRSPGPGKPEGPAAQAAGGRWLNGCGTWDGILNKRGR